MGGRGWRRQGKLREVVGRIQRLYDEDMTRYIIHYHYWIGSLSLSSPITWANNLIFLWGGVGWDLGRERRVIW